MSNVAAVTTAPKAKAAVPPARPVSTWLAQGITSLSLLGPPAIWAVLGWRRRWVAEDGFITLRVVRQLAAGHGPVFNVGERVEASTSLLWTLLLAFVHELLRIRLEILAVGLGLVLSVIGLLLAGLAARQLWPGRVAVPLGALIVVALPPFWDFATSGLECGLTFAWLGLAAYLLARHAIRPVIGDRAWLAALAVGFGPLVRPDLVLVAGPMLLTLAGLRAGRGVAARRRAATVIAAGLATPVAYQCFRMGYYAALVPNPGLAKEASQSWWPQGLSYLADLVGPYHLLVPLAAVAAALALLMLGEDERGMARGGPSRLALAASAPVVGGLLHGLYVVRVGGDFMHGRLLLPALFAICTPVMVIAPRRRAGWLPAVLVGVWALAAVGGRPDPVPGIPPSGIANERATWVMLSGRAHPVHVEDYRATPFWKVGDEARGRLAAGEGGVGIYLETGLTFVPSRDEGAGRVAVVATNVGVTGMAAGVSVRVVDLNGIANAFGAHLTRARHTRIGHEKQLDFAWIWADLVAPGIPALADQPPHAGQAPSQGTPTDRIADAEAALRCGNLRRLGVATTSSLTPGRFVRNMVEAVRLHGFRYANDPAQARMEVCGSG